MGRFFECRSGCVECCEDTKIAIEPTVEDIVRISERRGIAVVEFFDEALVASFVPKSSEIKAFFRMPCEYVGEVDEGIQGCVIQDYKPIVCAIAPEDRAVSSSLDAQWEHCRIKPVTKARKRQLAKMASRLAVEEITTQMILYSPRITAPDSLLEHSSYFRHLAFSEAEPRALMAAAIDVVNDNYRDEVRKRFEQFQDDLEKYGTPSEVFNARERQRRRKVYIP